LTRYFLVIDQNKDNEKRKHPGDTLPKQPFRENGQQSDIILIPDRMNTCKIASLSEGMDMNL
jgi:hypothetical protein